MVVVVGGDVAGVTAGVVVTVIVTVVVFALLMFARQIMDCQEGSKCENKNMLLLCC